MKSWVAITLMSGIDKLPRSNSCDDWRNWAIRFPCSPPSKPLDGRLFLSFSEEMNVRNVKISVHERYHMILPKDRDPRFITIRRGGTLTDSDHHLLASWAAACAEHVLHFFEEAQPSDSR